MISFTLPFPPSVNSYWRHPGAGKHLISARGREYRAEVWAAIKAAFPGVTALAGPIAVTLTAFPPDLRRRDLDNLPKGVLDGLTHAGLWGDDSQIRDLRVRWGEVRKGGAMLVEVVKMEAAR